MSASAAGMSPSVEMVLGELQILLARFQRQRTPVIDLATATELGLSAQASVIYRGRRARRVLFGDHGDLFGEPAWDMLLDLFVARETGQLVSVSSACISADVPATTALRWLGILERRGLVRRMADRCDGRRWHMQLSDEAHTAMRRWLEGWA